MHEVRDAGGRFVARARTSASAHRASRRVGNVGSCVNRAMSVIDLSHRVADVLRRAGLPEGSFAAHGTTVHEGYQPSVAGFVVRRTYEKRVYVDHAGGRAAEALPRYATVLRAAGLYAAIEPLRGGSSGKGVLFVSDEPIAPPAPTISIGPTYLRRGKTTDDVFARATRCRMVVHTYSPPDEAEDCAPADAAEAFRGEKRARMMLRDDGAHVFVISSYWGYTRYELWS